MQMNVRRDASNFLCFYTLALLKNINILVCKHISEVCPNVDNYSYNTYDGLQV